MDIQIRSRKSIIKKRKHTGFSVDTASRSSLIPDYNSLRDPNLVGFFASKYKRKLLFDQKLITRRGFINDRIAFRPIFDESLRKCNTQKKLRSQTPDVKKKSPRLKKVSPSRSKSKSKLPELKRISSTELKEVINRFRTSTTNTVKTSQGENSFIEKDVS
ncbi:unnamed protein product [Blepharisma stoltei]|uniref:Uncharacterized protein n=1 Tax=Blepharisma stoltei TaxID=1481888 RepID=A0AAU9IM83_9CILI|nr:unnamed protein product [Blepharisma stoltei]